MFPTKINHSCLECWSKTIFLSLSFPDIEHWSSESCTLHVLFEIMCQTAVKQSPFLTGFPPLGSHRKLADPYAPFAGVFTFASLKFLQCKFSLTLGQLQLLIREKKVDEMRKAKREESTMSSGGGVNLPWLCTESSICVDAYHMCSQSACFSLHHVVCAKRRRCYINVLTKWKM